MKNIDNFYLKFDKKHNKSYYSNICKQCINSKNRNTYISKKPHPIYNNYYSLEEDQFLIDNYGLLPVKIIQQKLNRTFQSIVTRAKKLGLKSNRRTYVYDDFFFNQITNKNSYYAGLLAADGCIFGNLCTITLKKHDLNILRNFQKDLKSTRPIYLYKNKYHCLSINSKQICYDLKLNFNIVERKSLILDPPNIDFDCAAHYIRGYIDGDGCFSGNQLIILGTYSLLLWIGKCFSNYDSTIKFSLNSNKSIHRLVISKNQIIKVYDYIYKDKFFDTRKYNKCLNMLNLF
jgi:hypothetical protein